MIRMRNMTALLMVLLMAFTLAACGPKTEETSGDGQNPVMNFVGNYQCDRAGVLISAEGEDGASALVTWGSSANENSTWTMSGSFDSEALIFSYNDCVRTDYVYSDNGDIESQEEVYTGGHGAISFKDGEELSLTWQDDQENIADGMVFTYTGAAPAGIGEDPGEMTGMANPWQTAESAEAAAEGAGIDGLEIPEDTEISLGTIKVDEYRYMDGIAEADIPIAAVEMTIRKGRADAAAESGDISGDYNTYAREWTQNIKGLEVKCFGNREGEATKTIWSLDDTLFSITAYGAGGDDDFGLSADDLSSLINGIQ